VIIDPRHLIQLHVIVELGSFHSAAGRLGLTQPGLSRNIRLLESRLGVQLLVRGKHGAHPTDEGKALASYGRKLYELSQQASTAGTSLRQGDVGELRLGASFSMANSLIAEPVSRFLINRPKASIRVTPGSTLQLLEKLDSGQLDLVIGGTQMLPPEHGLRFEPLLENNLEVIARIDHPLAHADAVTPAELRHYRWVACLEPDPLRCDVDAAMVSLGVMRGAIAMETASLSLLSEVLERTDFLSLIPSPVALSLVRSGRFSRLAVHNRYPLRPLGIASRADSQTSPLSNAFIQALREWARDHQHDLEIRHALALP
jgi:LysR family transcriptional regulator, pca operon transcriptional activator